RSCWAASSSSGAGSTRSGHPCGSSASWQRRRSWSHTRRSIWWRLCSGRWRREQSPSRAYDVAVDRRATMTGLVKFDLENGSSILVEADGGQGDVVVRGRRVDSVVAATDETFESALARV